MLAVAAADTGGMAVLQRDGAGLVVVDDFFHVQVVEVIPAARR